MLATFFQFEIEKALSWETEGPISLLELDPIAA
jgi:hypothetical protein